MASDRSTAPEALADALRDRYLLDRELGRGGMAVVYLARDLRHGRPVALKVFLPDAAGSLGADRFHREIRVTASLQHPHILPIFDSGYSAGQLWYTMPFVAGESLRRRLQRQGRLEIAEAVGLGREIADALAYAHAQGVVHRDIKPENILLSGGHALVADFGVARVLGPTGSALTAVGAAIGSPAYMSPEQVAGDPVDGRSDLYALGCVLFEMLAGRPPFTGDNAMAVMCRRLVEPAPSLTTLRSECPPTLATAVGRALARDPAERLPDCAVLAAALVEPLAPAGSDVISPPTGAERPELVEREEFLNSLDWQLTAAVNGAGSTVVVSGEAGIGKTALVETFARTQRSARVLWGWCEALFTPRPLGPLHDIAGQLGGELYQALRSGSSRETIFAAVLAELGPAHGPTVLVLEDVHWADEATLDLLKFLGRRAHRLPVLVIVTLRDDEMGPAHPLRWVLGDLPGSTVRRLELRPLSEAAVSLLARRAGRPDSGLYSATGGNPFYVSEVLASSQPGIPATVRDAVLGRAMRSSEAARVALETVSTVPGKAEPWLVDRLLGPDTAGLEECLGAGILVSDHQGVGFRHELARRAVEESLVTGRRRFLHTRVLAALEVGPAPVVPARLVHHAEAAGDAVSVRRYAPLAARQASALGAHREAAAHYEKALRSAGELDEVTRAILLEDLSYEEYLIDRLPQAITAREEALAIWRKVGDRRREGAALRWRSRLAWTSGRRREAEQYAAAAVAALEPLGEGPELAMAYSTMAQLHMLAYEKAETEAWGARAIALAERLDNRETLAHALTNVGFARLGSPTLEPGLALLERALEVAFEGGFQEHISRCYAGLVPTAVSAREHVRAELWLREGLAYTEARDLDFWTAYLRAWRTQLRLDQGAWAEAEREAEDLLGGAAISPVSRIPTLCVLGRLRARRGQPWKALLDEARGLAESAAELQRLAPVALARAEAAWLAGDLAGVAAEAREAFELTLAKDRPWVLGPLAVWMHRAGALPRVPEGLPPAFALELRGEAVAAAAEWSRLGCPYERALALAGAGGPAVTEAVEILSGLGAVAAVRRISLR